MHQKRHHGRKRETYRFPVAFCMSMGAAPLVTRGVEQVTLAAAEGGGSKNKQIPALKAA